MRHAQVFLYGTGRTHGDFFIAADAVKVHRTAAAPLAHDQMRHAQVRIRKAPTPQALWGLLQAGGQVNFAALQGGFQRVLIGKPQPLPLHTHALQQAVHQVHVGPRQALQAPIKLRPGRLHHQANPQGLVIAQPRTLLRAKRRPQGQHITLGRAQQRRPQ